jgi:hypothetical protein
MGRVDGRGKGSDALCAVLRALAAVLFTIILFKKNISVQTDIDDLFRDDDRGLHHVHQTK